MNANKLKSPKNIRSLHFSKGVKQAIMTSMFFMSFFIYGLAKEDEPRSSIVESPYFFQETISGVVTDQEGTPLAGVNVIVQGTTVGVMTDFDGRYEITASQGSTLVFSFIGMKTQNVVVGTQTSIDISMEESTAALDEVVVIGFGEKRKKDLTGSISTVSAKELEKVVLPSPQYALQGNTTGVRVINTSGDPNSPPQIYVRGIGSWQGNSQPLYVIDGQIITPPTSSNLDEIGGGRSGLPPNLFTMINPNDIESISVLKDASAAAIYGSRGANGVVLITTKTGNRGKPKLEYSSRIGFQNIDTWDVLNTEQYRQLVTEMYQNSLNPDLTIEANLYGRNAADDLTRLTNFSPQFDPQSPYYIASNNTYDWNEQSVKRGAVTTSHDLKFSGATEFTDFYIGIGYDKQESTLAGNVLDTYRASVNVNSKINNWLKVGVNYKFALQEQQTQDVGLLYTATVAPWQPLMDPDGPFGYQAVIDPPPGNWQPARIFGQGSQDNFLAKRNLNRSAFNNMRHLGHGYFEISPLDGLKLRGSLNLDYVSQDRINTTTYRTNIFNVVGNDPATSAPAAPNSLGSHNSRQNNIFNYQYDFTLTYDKSFGNHNFNLTAALQDQYQRRQFKDLTGSNLINISNLDRISYSSDLANNTSILGYEERFWFGYVGRLSYNYNSSYYLDFSFRRDASSGLAKDYRWGNFYSVSGAWRISNEKFMEKLTFINDLKLRGGYGEAGNDEAAAGRFAYLSTVLDAGSYSFGSGNGDAVGNYVLGSSVPALPNKSLVWEVAQTTYVGLDATLLDHKVDFTAEVYRRRQNGIQQFVQLPLSVGTNDPLQNIGVLENRGLDLSVGYNNGFGDFTFGLRGNLSFLKNEVIELYNDQPLFATNQFGRTYRVEEGRALGVIWGYKVGGIFQNQEEIDAFYANTPDNNVTNTAFVAPGDMYFQDIQGNPTEEEKFYSRTPDGQVNTYDQTEIGNTIPGYTYGINLNAGYKNFDLSLNFYGEGDVDRYNWARAQLESMTGPSNHSVSVLDRWTPSNTDTNIPRAVASDPAGNNRMSDRFVESAAFFRLNNWQLGYSLPDSVLDYFNNAIGSLRLYVGGQNNIYINKWSGIDPVNDDFPLPKTWMFGIKATF